MTIVFHAIPTETATRIRRSGIDAYGHPVERHLSDGSVYPCRHCLGAVPAGRDYLVLAHRPFRSENPYAETGPIFLCADPCERLVPCDTLPEDLRSESYIVRGYSADERIVYGTGRVVPTPSIPGYARELFARGDIAFADVRSAANNCFQLRILPGT
ncbi:DUF1203 domain-containing protein [Rhodobacterales bacterium HKCCE2091]|nr:DUF1203 domain-containing protein [Rhodobacterales bacterium HKCCE2091]